jgi:hypothetical protein
VTEDRLQRAQEETKQATQALKQVQEVLVEQCRLAEQEKVSLQTKFEGEKAQIQQEKEYCLTKKLEVKEAVNRELHSVIGLETKAEDCVEHQVEQLMEAIQQLHQRIAYVELCRVPNTPWDVRDQREATAQSTVERIKALTMECKKLSDRSAQNYEKITENP